MGWGKRVKDFFGVQDMTTGKPRSKLIQFRCRC